MFAYWCSPLSCNHESVNHPVTADCLLANEDDGYRAALAFSREEPEPGPYYLFKVYAKDPIAVSVAATANTAGTTDGAGPGMPARG